MLSRPQCVKNNSPLVHAMAGWRKGDNPLPEKMPIKLYNVRWHHYDAMNESSFEVPTISVQITLVFDDIK